MNFAKKILKAPLKECKLLCTSTLLPKRFASAECEVRRDKCVKHECSQPEPNNLCKSLIECGPCSKHKYMDLRCKVAIVTGGACGIGFATANELLCQEAYKVIIADVDKKHGTKAMDSLQKVHGKNRVCFVQLDVNNNNQFKNVFQLAYDRFGGADILINNAQSLTDLKWEHNIDTNLKSVLRGSLLGLEWIQKEKPTMKGGVVVNIASVLGLDPDVTAPYLAAAKHGAVGVTRALGDPYFFQKTGVRIVGLCPGRTKTSEPEDTKDLSPEFKISYFDPTKPSQNPRKVAKAVIYLIRYAPSGSIWIAEDSQLYKTVLKSRDAYSEIFDIV